MGYSLVDFDDVELLFSIWDFMLIRFSQHQVSLLRFFAAIYPGKNTICGRENAATASEKR